MYNKKKYIDIMIKLPVLYKYGNNGKILFWEIIVEEEKYYTRYGVLDGKVIESVPTVLKDSEDAMSKAQSMWEHKCKALRYYDSIERAKLSVDGSSYSFRPPMLAKVYGGKYDESYKFIQPKLDGIRCNCFMKDGDVIALSKNNHEFKQIRHITDSLSDILSKYPSLHLDGELYNHTFHDNFEELVSLIRKEKEQPKDVVEMISKYVEYHIYDLWDDNNPDLTFSERNAIINDICSNIPHVVIVPTYQINNSEDIYKYLNLFLGDGYEGAIIRLDSVYEHKRSSNLLKYKLFSDDEFEILDIECGNGKLSDVAGYCWIRLSDELSCKCNIKGSMSFKRDLLCNKDKYIGKMGTVTYFGKTNSGKLRFPYLKCIRDYE